MVTNDDMSNIWELMFHRKWVSGTMQIRGPGDEIIQFDYTDNDIDALILMTEEYIDNIFVKNDHSLVNN